MYVESSKLIVVEILNAFVFKSERRRLLYSYCGVVIFSLYLIYDFNYLEKAIAAGDKLPFLLLFSLQHVSGLGLNNGLL